MTVLSLHWLGTQAREGPGQDKKGVGAIKCAERGKNVIVEVNDFLLTSDRVFETSS